MQRGRPSAYKEEYTDKIYEYLELYKELGDTVPSIEGFADYIGVSKKTIYNWCNLDENNKCVASENFLHATERISTKQGRELQNKGLDGTFNSTITKLMLSANHDMKEKSETDLTSKGEQIGIDPQSQLEKVYGKQATGKDDTSSS